jgi:hypothetical protein
VGVHVTICATIRSKVGAMMRVRLNEVLTVALLVQHEQHIRDFLAMEGITPAADLGETILSERQIKELLEELASM